MLRIMIAEDEVLPRIALRNIIEKEHLFVGEAASGLEAEKLALLLKPDVILVDIVMPDFDGFELIRRLSPQLPNTRYLIISNTENNEYLKKALRAHVDDYLIKGTVTAEMLLESLDNLENEISKREFPASDPAIADEDSSSSRNYLPIFSGSVTDTFELESICTRVGFPLTEQVSFFCVRFGIMKNSRSISSRSIRFMIREILDDSGDGRTVSLNDTEIVTLFSPPDNTADTDSVKDFADRVISSVKSSFGVCLSCGISKAATGFCQIRSAFDMAGEALNHSFFTGSDSIIFYEDLPLDGLKKAALNMTALVQNVLCRDFSSDIDVLTELLSEIKVRSKNSNLQKEFVQGIYIDVLYHALSIYNIDEENPQQFSASQLSTCSTLDELHDRCIELLRKICRVSAVPGNESVLIRQIKEYIDENIQDQLSLDEIARHVYINPTYLSQLFKKKTGEKLRSYITQERIRKARQFLSDGVSIHETAVRTGFTSDSYFIQCFKDVALTTPREYIRSINRKDPD